MFYHDQALEFVARGYCAVVFMRRGYGRSQGEWSESYRRRNEYDFVMAGRATAADARAVIKAMSGFEFVDDRAVLAVGQSAGGLGVVALAADPPANLKGVINFAGGRGSTRNNFVAGGSKLAEAYGVFGRTSRLPSLWIYTKNDKFFGPQLSKDFHRRFVQGGGRVQFRLLGDFGSDGHGLFSNRSGIAEWRPLVSSFLDKSGLPNWAEEPPLPSPDVQAMPEGMNQKGQDQWAVYLDRAPNKAWAFNRRTGAWGYRTRQDSVEAAVEGALKAAGEGAEVISINGKPVLQQPVEGEGGR
jgi:dienelactone hydrolase